VDLRDRKRSLRREIALRGSQVTAAQSSQAGRAAAAALTESPEFEASPTLALFASLADEISTRSLYALATAAGKRCLFPRCLPGGELEFAVVKAWEELKPRRLGVLEPPPQLAAAILGPADLVVVPGRAFDVQGGRLGRGMGYYDRFFASLECSVPILFGFSFAFQLVPQVPVGEHDHRMDGIVTEDGLHRVADGQGPPGRKKTRDAL
jgi:5-formyltetrahydrofolate cyclo-ligase